MLDWNAIRPPIAIALGAVGGSLARYYLSQAIGLWGNAFPYGTILVNFSGSIGLGMLASFSTRGLSPELRLAIGTGFLGSYTTFSTYALESMTLWWTGRGWTALVYWLGSAVLGLVGIGLGGAIVRGGR
jgi:fluoride exporter